MISDDRQRGIALARYISWLEETRFDSRWDFGTEAEILTSGLDTDYTSILTNHLHQPKFAEPDSGISPAFRSAEISTFEWMIHKARVDSSDTLLAEWADALLRFCEVRSADLLVRAERKWGSRRNASLGLIQMMAALASCYSFTGDVRLLNILLKLGDISSIWQSLAEVPIAESPYWETKRGLRSMCILTVVSSSLESLESRDGSDA